MKHQLEELTSAFSKMEELNEVLSFLNERNAELEDNNQELCKELRKTQDELKILKQSVLAVGNKY